MRFDIIHKNPVINAELLPDYSLKRVNIREGWQMLSDIGHAHNVKWEGQNKEYNKYHPNTWKHWKNKNKYQKFILYYHACLLEYIKRFNKTTKFHKWFETSQDIINAVITQIQNYTEEQSQAKYLLDRKHSHLSNKEIKTLKNVIENRIKKEN